MKHVQVLAFAMLVMAVAVHAACPTATSAVCSGRGECANDLCTCDIGYSTSVNCSVVDPPLSDDRQIEIRSALNRTALVSALRTIFNQTAITALSSRSGPASTNVVLIQFDSSTTATKFIALVTSNAAADIAVAQDVLKVNQARYGPSNDVVAAPLHKTTTEPSPPDTSRPSAFSTGGIIGISIGGIVLLGVVITALVFLICPPSRASLYWAKSNTSSPEEGADEEGVVPGAASAGGGGGGDEAGPRRASHSPLHDIGPNANQTRQARSSSGATTNAVPLGAAAGRPRPSFTTSATTTIGVGPRRVSTKPTPTDATRTIEIGGSAKVSPPKPLTTASGGTSSPAPHIMASTVNLFSPKSNTTATNGSSSPAAGGSATTPKNGDSSPASAGFVMPTKRADKKNMW